MSMHVTEYSEEVLFALGETTKVDRSDIESLKAKALRNKRERVRLCAHQSIQDAVHEMLIVHTKGTYIRPHKHPKKGESFHVIEGSLDIVIFNDTGEVIEVIEMAEYSSGATFFWRLSANHFHTVIPRSNTVVFHETTSGPFERATSSVPAPWSPEENDHRAVKEYMDRLHDLISSSK